MAELTTNDDIRETAEAVEASLEARRAVRLAST
jgi:hypothetical protein